MSRYTEFEEDEEANSSLPNEEDEEYNDLVCVKNLLPTANPLMNKIEYAPYEPKNYYPVHLTKLPHCLSHHEYYIDRNNMTLIDESAFSHEKMKKDLAKLLQKNKNSIPEKELFTLKEYYSHKAVIYEKYNCSNEKSNYFATYVLNMSSIVKEQGDKMGKSGFVIRNKTPLMTERAKTDRTLVCRPPIDFNSNFESGNLYKVYQREFNQYDLILQNDINTKGNNQWFFFSVKNVPKNTNVKFNIVNLSKRFSLFEYGMKPAVFSMMKYQKRQIGWVRDGSKVNYYQNSQIRKQSSAEPYFNLSFEYRFTYQGDIVYFSYSIPYTFNNLTSFLSNTLANRAHHSLVKIRSLGSTIGGNQVNLFEITNSQSKIHKKSVWILSRQHSGEVTSSFMAEGIINYLLSESPGAIYLLNHFIFKIVPMVNIDGVVHGNTRAELIGCDSNRKWTDPHKVYQPIVYNLRKMIEKDSSTEMVLDLHSHSRKLGTFFYGNHANHLDNLIKVFPMMVYKNDERFDFRSNRFRGGSNQTARKVLFDRLNIPFIYTVESSFFGYQKEGDFKITPYQPNDYREMGQSILKTFAEFIKKQNMGHDHRLFICEKEQLEQSGNLWEKMQECEEVESVGSDEDPGEDEFSNKELEMLLPKAPKKTTKKKKKKVEPKKQQKPKKDEKKKDDNDLKLKKIDKDSYYKKYFSGRCSLNVRSPEFLPKERKSFIESRNFCVQVDLSDKAVLHRSSMNSMPNDKTSSLHEKILEKKSLCVIGQKVQEDLIINDTSVGIQVEMAKVFLRNRNDLQLASQGTTKRIFRSNPKMTTVILHNENNFLNRGDVLHSILRQPSRR